MREIKFRNIYRRHFDAHIWVLEYPIGILEDERSQLRSMANNELWELIATVQFTGLLDKNGVEIYEGDIVSHKKDILAPTDYYSGEPAFHERTFVRTGHITIRPSCGVFINGKTQVYDYCEGNLIETLKQTSTQREFHIYAEVIGNIYESPELLEAK